MTKKIGPQSGNVDENIVSYQEEARPCARGAPGCVRTTWFKLTTTVYVDGGDCDKPKRGTMICIVVEFYETMRPFAGLEFFSEDGWKESVENPKRNEMNPELRPRYPESLRIMQGRFRV